jgi:hypothetical protein
MLTNLEDSSNNAYLLLDTREESLDCLVPFRGVL